MGRAINKNLKAEKKELIIQSGHEIFSKIGFRRTTIRQIAEAAKMAVGTIYLYFKSKDEILQEILSRHAEEHGRLFESVLKLDFEDALRKIYEDRFCVMSKHQKNGAVFLLEAIGNKKIGNILYKKSFAGIHEKFVSFLTNESHGRKIRKISNPEATALVMMSAVASISLWKECLFSRQLKSMSYSQIIETIVDVFANGLSR